jgi:hypothetical protein
MNEGSIEKRLGWKKTLVFSLIPALIMVVVIEGGARVFAWWAPPAMVDAGQGFTGESRLFVEDPSDPAFLMTSPNKTLKVHEQHLFRPQRFLKEKPAGTLRAFFLGGSSVNYLDYELPLLEERVAEALDGFDTVEIINCGGLSYGSHRLVLIAAEVLEYDPDLMLIYSGHNEFEELEQFKLAKPWTAPLQDVLSYSAVFRLVRDRMTALQVSRLQQERNARILQESIPDSSRAWGYAFSDEELAQRMDTYRGNLGHIIEMAQARGVKVVIGTVPSNLMRPALHGEPGARYEAEVLPLFDAGEHEEGKQRAQAILSQVPRHQSSDAENAIIRELAVQHGVALADVEQAVIAREPHGVPGETMFGDHCHLNPEGNQVLTGVYAREIIGLFRVFSK